MIVGAAGGSARVIRRWGPDPQPWNGAPAWSPDGSRIVVALATFVHHSAHTAQGTALYVLDVGRRAADRRISSWQLGAGNSSWSPDGSQIAFNSEGGHSANLYVIHADGSWLKELLAAGHGRDGRAALDREPVASLCRR